MAGLYFTVSATINDENDLFLKFLFTRRAGMKRHGTAEDYTVPPRILRGATHHSALCAIFG